MGLLYLLLAAVTWFMTGLIWFVQIVHYPLFASVGSDKFLVYIKAHCNLTGLVVIVPMVIQLLLSGLVAFENKSTHSGMLWLNFALVIVIWLLTGFASVPCFNNMCSAGFSESVHGRLVLTNWARTILWSVCSLILLLVLRSELK